MPIYEYDCTHCGHRFDVMHAVGAAPPRCERCGRAVRRVFSPVGIIFKGPGFHITDYRKTPAPADGDGKKSDTASSTGSAAGKPGGNGAGAAKAKSDGTPASSAGSKAASRSGGGGKGS